MTHYFYKDMFAAAWMMQHQDMKFEVETDPGEVIAVVPIPNRYEGKYILTAESVELLKPRIGDLIKQWGSLAGMPIYDIALKTGGLAYVMPGNEYNYFGSMERIIERNNKAFIWPEKEKDHATTD